MPVLSFIAFLLYGVCISAWVAQAASPEQNPLENRIAALETRLAKPPKDVWDKLSAISGLTSGLLVAGFGWWAANVYTRRQKQAETRRNDLLTIEKFLPYLSSEDPGTRRTALTAISALGDEELAVRFATSLGGPGSVSALMEFAGGKGIGAAAANAELLRLFDFMMQRVVKVAVNGKQVATGFELGLNNYVGTDSILSEIHLYNYGDSDPEVRAIRQRVSIGLSRVWILPPDSHFSGEVLQLKIGSGISGAPAIAQEETRPGDRVVILTRDQEGNPRLHIGRQTPSGIEAAISKDARGSPVFNEHGQFLGLLLISDIEGASTGGSLLPYQDLVEFAAGGGSIIRRIRDDDEAEVLAKAEPAEEIEPLLATTRGKPKRPPKSKPSARQQ